MKNVDYKNELGRWYRVLLPDDAPESEAPQGILVGPPPVVEELGLPEPLATRLHNELFNRSLWNSDAVRHQFNDVQGALQAALSLDASAIYEVYVRLEEQTAEDEQKAEIRKAKRHKKSIEDEL